jgi:prefoldin subunit 5
VLVLSLLLLVTSCSPSSSSEAVRTLRQKNADLQERVATLERELDEKDRQVRATTRLIHKILDDLSALADRKDLIRGLGVNPPAQLAADFPENEQSIRAAEAVFTRHLSFIESNLRDSQQQIDRVRNNDRIEPGTVASLEAAVTRLQTETAHYRDTIASLRENADSLAEITAQREATADALRQENDDLRQVTGTLERTYVAIGTGDELEARGIIDQRFLRSPRIVGLQPQRFTETSMSASRIALPAGASDASILSIHQKAPDLYTVANDTLTIHDPRAFWARSKFLIVQVER